MALVSCPTGTLISSDPCDDTQPVSRISITGKAVRCINYERAAASVIVLGQSAPGVWLLDANNSLALSQSADHFRTAFGDAVNTISLSNHVCVSGGRTLHVNVANPLDVVYIKGDETTDESVRLIIHETDGITHIEKRELGVWNLTSFEIGTESLNLGQDLALSAAGDHLQLTTTGNQDRRFIPEIPFDDSGSLDGPRAPLPGPLIERLVVQSDLSNVLSSTIHTIGGTAPVEFIISSYYLQIGPVAPVDPVLLEVRVGDPPNDILFFSRVFAASEFIANSEIRLDISPGFGFRPNIFVETRITSPTAFDMLGDTGVWVAVDTQVVEHEPILTFPTGFNRLLFDVSSSMVLTNEGNPIASGRQELPT